MNAKWYAVCTKPRCEKKVLSYLTKQKIEAFCPLKKVETSWSFRKYDFVPVIPSYVFVRADESQLSQIKKINGVVNFMYWLNKPVVVKDREIETMKNFLHKYETVNLEKVPITYSYKLKLVEGAPVETGGIVLSAATTVKASLPSIGFVMSAEVKQKATELDNVKYIYNQPYSKISDAG